VARSPRLPERAACLLLLLAGLLLPVTASSEEKSHELIFGSVAMDIPAVMHRRLRPLVEYLSATLQRPVRLQLSPNMKAAIHEISNGSVDISYLTPVSYIRARESGKVELIGKTATDGRGHFRLMIVVRDSSPYLHPRELQGRSFAFGDPAALLQRAVVARAGLKPGDFSRYEFLGHYDNIVRAVLNRDFDAGIVKDTMAWAWQDKGLRILYTSPELPPYNIVINSRLDPALRRRIRRAFLNLSCDDPAQCRVIKALDSNYSGFLPTSDDEYDVVREMIAPYRQDKAGKE